MPQPDIDAIVTTIYDDYRIVSRPVLLAFCGDHYEAVDAAGTPIGRCYDLGEWSRPGLPGSGIRRVIMRHRGIMMHWLPRRRTVMGILQEQDNGDESWKAVNP